MELSVSFNSLSRKLFGVNIPFQIKLSGQKVDNKGMHVYIKNNPYGKRSETGDLRSHLCDTVKYDEELKSSL